MEGLGKDLKKEEDLRKRSPVGGRLITLTGRLFFHLFLSENTQKNDRFDFFSHLISLNQHV